MVEGSKDSLFGNFAARAKYFVKSNDNTARDITDDEAF
jgi:hypothetical protein